MSGGARSYVAAALVSQFDSEEGGCQECTILTDSNVRCVHFHASLSRAPSRTYTASSLSSTTPPTTSLAAEVAEARKSITLAIRRATSAEARIASLKARCERHGRQSAHDVSPSPLVNLPSAHVEQALSTRAAEAVPMTQSWHTKFASRNFPAAQETHAALEPSGFLPVTHATQIVALFAVETEPGTSPSEQCLHAVAEERSVAAKYWPGMQSLHVLFPVPLVT